MERKGPQDYRAQDRDSLSRSSYQDEDDDIWDDKSLSNGGPSQPMLMDLESVDVVKTQTSQDYGTQEMDWDAFDFGELPTDLALPPCSAFEVQFEDTAVLKPSESLRTPTQLNRFECMPQKSIADDAAMNLEGPSYIEVPNCKHEGPYGKSVLPSPPSFATRFSSAYCL